MDKKMVPGFGKSTKQTISIRESTTTTKEMVRDSIAGKMAMYIMDNLKAIWDKDSAKWDGTQVRFMKEVGKTGFKMGLESFISLPEINFDLLEIHNSSMEFRWKPVKLQDFYLKF